MSNSPLIQPRTLRGFRDHLPAAMIPRERMIATAAKVYRSFGFSPIDTPALEYEEILTGKGGEESDRQMFRFEDNGGRRVGMRFDLTVPLARFAAQWAGQLGTPFKRYHIATVWRGEKPHRGRYREFMQCDFDTIGTTSVAADIETALVIHDLLLAIGFAGFKIFINNRQVLTGVLEKIDLLDKSVPVLRALDKLAKIGRDKVAAEMMATADATAEQANKVLQLADVKGSPAEVLAALVPMVSGSEVGEAGLARLTEVIEGCAAGGVPQSRLQLDVATARGLDYYTGTIYETFLDDLPEIGSVCSGGRYDNLAGLFTKQELPGVGASLGLDRLLAAMEELQLLPDTSTPAQVLMTQFDGDRLGDYLRIAAQLRQAGVEVEVYPDPKKIGQQLKYANLRGHKIALIAGGNEFAAAQIQVKNLQSGDQQNVVLSDEGAELVAAIRDIIESE